MKFVPQADPTVGCEWELQLVREDTLELADGILALMGKLDDYALIKQEFLQCCIEINTPPCMDGAEIESALQRVLEIIDRHARRLKVRLAAAGTHPFDDKPGIVTPSERFLRHSDERGGSPAVHPVTFATHIHVACPDGDAAIRAMRRLTPCIPVLLALGANSPFWHGADTGFLCFRQRLLTSNPTFGLPPHFATWDDYNGMLAAAGRSGTIETFRDLHWDIRPHGDLGTLETRVFDAQIDAHRIAQIAALVRALVVLAGDASTPDSSFPGSLPRWMEIENHFRACKSGLDAMLLTSIDGDTTPAMQIIRQLLDTATATASRLGDGALFAELEQTLVDQNGALRQHEAWEHRHSSRDVARFLVEQLDDVASLPASA